MQRRTLRRYASPLTALLRLVDVTAVALLGWAAYFVRFGIHASLPTLYVAVILGNALLAALLFPAIGLYRPWRARGWFVPAARAFSATLLLFFLTMFALGATHTATPISRLWLAVWGAGTALALVTVRLGIYGVLRILRMRGYNRRNVVIVGCGAGAAELLRKVEERPWAGFHMQAVFGRPEHTPTLGHYPVTPLETLSDYADTHLIDEVWIALSLEHGADLRTVLDALRASPASVRYVPDMVGLYLLNHGISRLLDTPMIDLTASPLQGVNGLVKTIEDKVLATLILVLTAPLMALIAIGVKLTSPGHALYRQERLGWNGRPFMMLKFRTMPVDAEAHTGPVWNRHAKRRATPFGAFLRRTSLDELPQFINVLKGDMSIVGPRPERPVFVSQFKREIPGYMQKHLVKAGITGWAQINGWRGDTDLKRRIEHDLYYIEHWSLALDFKIIGLTLFRGFVHPNAY